MKYTNILEKLLCLYNIIKTSPLDIAFLVIVIVSLILLFRKVISKRVCFVINVVASLILILLVISNNLDFLSGTFDSVVDYTFTNIYFPSVYVYLVVLLVMNIFCIFSLFNDNIDKRHRLINKISLLVINFIFALVLENVAKNSIDLFKKESLFTSTNLVVLLETSIIVFLVWLVLNGIIYLSNIITRRVVVTQSNKELIENEVNMNVISSTINEEEILEDYNNDEQDVIEVKNKFIPEQFSNIKIENEEIKQNEIINDEFITNKFVPNINLINNNVEVYSFDLSALIPQKKEVAPITSNIVNDYEEVVNNKNIAVEDIFGSILGNNLSLEVKEDKKENDTYTLNDYRIFNKMLKDIREHNNSSRISIDKNLEYRLITKYSTEAYDMFKRMLKIYSN